MDFSDDDEVPERDIRELNAMGWARQTFGNTDRNVMSKMLKLLFDDFYIKVRCSDVQETKENYQHTTNNAHFDIFDSASQRIESTTSTHREK